MLAALDARNKNEISLRKSVYFGRDIEKSKPPPLKGGVLLRVQHKHHRHAALACIASPYHHSAPKYRCLSDYIFTPTKGGIAPRAQQYKCRQHAALPCVTSPYYYATYLNKYAYICLGYILKYTRSLRFTDRCCTPDTSTLSPTAEFVRTVVRSSFFSARFHDNVKGAKKRQTLIFFGRLSTGSSRKRLAGYWKP